MVPVLGNGPATGDEKSVRAFDPVSNAWEYLWPNGQGGLQNRDNYASLYIPQLDEIWVWGGSYLEAVPGALRSGRFSIAQRKWIATGTTDNSAFSDVVENFGGFLVDNGTAWSAEANMGMIFGGTDQGNPSNKYWIIEPNPSGSKPYKMSEVSGGPRPSPRDQCMNCLVAVGKNFYLFGGHTGNDENGHWITPPDLWKFNSSTRTWTRLADAPGGGYQSTLTYDVDRNVLVTWVYNKLYVFDLAAQIWNDQTPTGLPCIFNSIGVYSPTAKMHLFSGGNTCVDGSSPGTSVYQISLSGTPLAASAPKTAPDQGLTVLSSSPSPGLSFTSTLAASDLGVTGEDKVGPNNQTTSNGKADFHISVSGLRGNPTKVTITSDTGGIWQTPFNGANWIVATQYDGNGNGNLWFEQFSSNRFHVKVNYSDGTTDQADATKQVVTAPTSSSSIVTPASTPPPIVVPISSPSSPPSSTLTAAASPTAGLNMPLRTWVARRFNTPNAPAAGEGGGGDGSKHLRFAQNLVNGHIYELGGDYSVSGANSWYGLWEYDVVADKWTQPYPWCGYPGEMMLGPRDELGWVWDSKRQLFWALPGFVYPTTSFSCNNGATEIFGTILTFDPATNKWANPNAAPEPISGQKPKNGVYDPLTDSIYRSGVGVSGVGWTVYHIANNTWDYYETSHALDGTYINNSELAFEYLAADIAHRKIYVIDPIYYRLFEFDMDRHTITIKAPIPEPNPARIALSRNLSWTFKDFTMPVFDTVNSVLLYPYINALDDARPILLIYHPDTDTWETDPMYQPDGLTVRGNSFVFDTVNNVLVSFGGLAPGGDRDPTLTHFFLYRYGNGDGKTPSPQVATPVQPSAPASTLAAADLGVTGEDKVGEMNQTTPNGKPDFHVSVSGLRGNPTKVTITSDTGGIWETPFNNANWIVATQYDGVGNGHFWFERFTSNKFHVKVRYADNTTDEADAVKQAIPIPSPAPTPSVALSATTLAFGSQVVGGNAASQQVSLSNNGTGSLAIDIIRTTGDFSQSSNCASSLSAGGRCVITVTFQPLSTGSRTGTVSVSDNAEGSPHVVNLTGVGAAPFTTDTTPPIISIVAPSTQTVSKTVNGKVVANDDTGVRKIELYKDGTLFGSVASNQYTFDWDTTKESNGTHTLIAMAYDTSDNRSSTVMSVNIQNAAISPPSITIQSPVSGNTIDASAVKIVADVNSANAIAGVQFKIDGINLGPEIKVSPYTVTWDTTNMPNGAHAITAVVRDIAGLSSGSAPVTVQINRIVIPTVKKPALGRRF
jgi:hypothetical protein